MRIIAALKCEGGWVMTPGIVEQGKKMARIDIQAIYNPISYEKPREHRTNHIPPGFYSNLTAKTINLGHFCGASSAFLLP